jgi:hypothetical protein
MFSFISLHGTHLLVEFVGAVAFVVLLAVPLVQGRHEQARGELGAAEGVVGLGDDLGALLVDGGDEGLVVDDAAAGHHARALLRSALLGEQHKGRPVLALYRTAEGKEEEGGQRLGCGHLRGTDGRHACRYLRGPHDEAFRDDAPQVVAVRDVAHAHLMRVDRGSGPGREVRGGGGS